MKTVSIIVPVFNEENIVEELIERIIKTVDKLAYTFEFIVVDDGSTDATLKILLRLQKKDSRLRILKLSRNWGHQNAFNAGLDYADSDALILMDGDLEDPPELFGEFLRKWEEGFDIVYAVKESRHEARFKKLMFSVFYGLMERFSMVDIDRQSGMFFLMNRRVSHELKKFKERNKYYVGLRSFVGFRKTAIFYHRDKRFAGAPKQGFRKLVNYALDAFFAFSFFPIRLLTYFGLFILTIISIFVTLAVFIKVFKLHFWFFQDLPGWTSIILINFFVLAILIIFMGIIGEYIARIFEEVKNRPYYIVDTFFDNKNS